MADFAVQLLTEVLAAPPVEAGGVAHKRTASRKDDELLLQFRAAGIRDRAVPYAVKAAAAGTQGRHAEPLTTIRRIANYRKQNRAHKLTGRQERRLKQKGMGTSR